MHVFPATANDCILQTNSFGLVNRHIFRPTDKNGTACNKQWKGPADDISLRPLRGAAGQGRADVATASKNKIVPHSGRGEDTLWCTH